MECEFFSAMMIGPRNRQEDCIKDGKGLLQADLMHRRGRFNAGRVVFAVCDGMGGHQGGEEASCFVCSRVENYLWPEKITPEDIQGALAEIQAEAERCLPANSGTTIAGLAACSAGIVIFNAGDSRVYKIAGDRLEYLSHDHSLVQELVDRRMVNAETASLHPLKHMIDFGIGPAFKKVWPARTLHIACREFEKNCDYLLCTDGLTDIMSGAEIHDQLAGDPVENGAGLAVQARKKGLTDNTSFIIARIRREKQPEQKQ